MDNKSCKVAKSCELSHKFICKYCDYYTSRKSSWAKHIKTKKHIKKSLSNCYPPKMDNKKVAKRYFCECGKSYQFMSGLSKHKKKCFQNEVTAVGHNLKKGTTLFTDLKKGTTLFEKNLDEIEKIEKSENTNEEISALKEEIKDLKSFMKDMVTCQKGLVDMSKGFVESQKGFAESVKSNNDSMKVMAQSMKSNNKLIEVLSNNTGQTVYNNCNNQNNMTINVFLNEQCKDALNLTDFVQNIKVTLEDLQYTKDNGFVNGVTNIITKQLQDLKPTQRPIHCSDKKRLQFYVKDDDKWEKDKDNIKLTSSIKSVGMEQVKKMSEWEKDHPDYMNNPKELEIWQKMLENVSGGANKDEIKKNEHKIKKELGKVVDIKEELK